MTSNILPISDTLRVYDDILQVIGKTPLVRLQRLGRDLSCPLYAKVEFFNPGGSVKDRIAVNIIEEAERSGRLKPGGTVVEATSGNTGLGLAIVCAKRGYKAVFVMPDKMSQEKIQFLRAFGAKVVITPTCRPRRPALILQRLQAHRRRDPQRHPGQPVPQPRKSLQPLPAPRTAGGGDPARFRLPLSLEILR